MKIGIIRITNFRSICDLPIDLEQSSRFLIGENAIGKSSVVTAIARALGRDARNFQQADFNDPDQAIDIQVTLTGLSPSQLGIFAEAIDFNQTPSLTVGVQVTWDADTEELEITHGYPTKNWRPCTKIEREALDVYWIADAREPARTLQLGWNKGLMADLLSSLNLDAAISTAINGIKTASGELAGCDEFATLLREASAQLGEFMPNIAVEAFAVEAAASTELSLLRQLQLSLSHGGRNLPIENLSSGLAHLSLFAFSLLAVKARPGCILLMDEPELGLHPQCQRALVAELDNSGSQYVIATHSASILDHADPRRITRLYRQGINVNAARPSRLSDSEAAGLSRFTTARNAEAFFARTAILVEGDSDRFVIETLARRKARNLDAEGVSIVVLQGAGQIETFIALLGPNGLNVRLVGLCDANEHPHWARSLQNHAMITATDQAAMNAAGFFACDPDLEYVLIDTVGEDEVVKLIAAQGHAELLNRFTLQPANRGNSRREQLHDYLHSGGRQVIYGPLLADHLNVAALPAPLEGILHAI